MWRPWSLVLQRISHVGHNSGFITLFPVTYIFGPSFVRQISRDLSGLEGEWMDDFPGGLGRTLTG